MGWELSTASQVTTPIHPIDSPEDGKLTIGTPKHAYQRKIMRTSVPIHRTWWKSFNPKYCTLAYKTQVVVTFSIKLLLYLSYILS